MSLEWERTGNTSIDLELQTIMDNFDAFASSCPAGPAASVAAMLCCLPDQSSDFTISCASICIRI